jgi:hypothetical protein
LDSLAGFSNDVNLRTIENEKQLDGEFSGVQAGRPFLLYK